MERNFDEKIINYVQRWKEIYPKLILFYNSNSMKKRIFYFKGALRRELDLAVNGVLKMAGGCIGKKSNGSVLFSIGDCIMGKPVKKYFIEKIKS